MIGGNVRSYKQQEWLHNMYILHNNQVKYFLCPIPRCFRGYRHKLNYYKQEDCGRAKLLSNYFPIAVCFLQRTQTLS